MEARHEKHQEYKEFVGETAMVIRDIPASGSGKIYYRGAEWSAISENHAMIEAGSKVIIQRTEGITLSGGGILKYLELIVTKKASKETKSFKAF